MTFEEFDRQLGPLMSGEAWGAWRTAVREVTGQPLRGTTIYHLQVHWDLITEEDKIRLVAVRLMLTRNT